MSETSSFLDKVTITLARTEHGQGIYDTVRLAYGMTLEDECDSCISPEAVIEQLERFPEGQFVALYQDEVIAQASTMRVSRPPTDPPLDWMSEIGSLGISKHVPDGEWLYGVEMTVRPQYRKRGIATAMYNARFDLVRRLNLKGWYAGGMLMGYHHHAEQMTPREYGEKVIRGEIADPTVTMQMHRGFEAWAVIEEYLEEEHSGNAAVLIVWYNPDYKETE